MLYYERPTLCLVVPDVYAGEVVKVNENLSAKLSCDHSGCKFRHNVSSPQNHCEIYHFTFLGLVRSLSLLNTSDYCLKALKHGRSYSDANLIDASC